MDDSPLAKDEAFGIVPILPTEEAYQFLLIQHHAGHWGFPKGHADPGESALEAACREFLEETGISDYRVVGDISFLERYTFTRRRQKFEKTVLYFPAFVHSPIVKCQKEEIRAYAWADFDRAIALMSFKGGKRILIAAQQYLQNGLSQPMKSIG
ncbi:MAG: NUDIX domain-containing protein [Kovacikia sp.]